MIPTTNYIDTTETPNMLEKPTQITTENTIQKTVTPETDTESYMTDTEILTKLPDTNEETTDNQDIDTETTDDQDNNNETTDDQDTNEETTVDPDTNDELTTEFTADAQTTNRPVDTTKELELTTIAVVPLTNFPDHPDNKEIEIETTETPSIHTDIITETSHTQTNTTDIPTETDTQNSLTDLPGTSVNIGPEMDTNTQSTATDTTQTETLSTDTTEMLYFKLNQPLKN